MNPTKNGEISDYPEKQKDPASPSFCSCKYQLCDKSNSVIRNCGKEDVIVVTTGMYSSLTVNCQQIVMVFVIIRSVISTSLLETIGYIASF